MQWSCASKLRPGGFLTLWVAEIPELWGMSKDQTAVPSAPALCLGWRFTITILKFLTICKQETSCYPLAPSPSNYIAALSFRQILRFSFYFKTILIFLSLCLTFWGLPYSKLSILTLPLNLSSLISYTYFLISKKSFQTSEYSFLRGIFSSGM